MQYRSTAGEWSGALVNEPVAAGTTLRAAADAEAELRGFGVQIALAPMGELQILRYDRDALQIAVPNGRIGVHLSPFSIAKTVEIDLPQGGVWLETPGDYDIGAGDASAPAAVMVFAGGVRLGGGLDVSHIAAVARDAFSDWWRAQSDNADATAPALPGLAGTASLANFGQWELDPKLGNVWFPSDVSADWTPYRNGVWRFIAPWGWTWIASEPWGFDPAHYGRWAQIDGRWGWVPASRFTAAEYSPAVVAFIGTAGIGLSQPGDAGPAIAWFPLAPGESIGDADGDYRNRRSATAVPRAAFAGGQPIAAAVVDDIPAQRFVDAPVILQGLDIPPAGAPPGSSVATAAAMTEPALETVPEAGADALAEARQPFIVALHAAPLRAVLHAAPLRAAVHAAVHMVPRKLRVAVALHAHALVNPARWLHNRRRLADARGGA